jgi:transcriptional regulator with XRE-family HTH domain
MNLAEYLQHQLFKQKMTLYRLGKITGISYGYLDRIEKNIKKNPSYEILKKIAVAFGVDVQDLLQAVGYETKDSGRDGHSPAAADISVFSLSEYMSHFASSNQPLASKKKKSMKLSDIPPGAIGIFLDQPVLDFCIGDVVLIDPNGKTEHESVIMVRDENHAAIGRIIKARLGMVWTPFGSHTVKEVRKQWLTQNFLGIVVGLVRRY